jgi:hypothetical protein
MRKFLIQVLIFSLPIIAIIGLYEYFLFSMGESYPISMVFESQEKNHGSLFIRKYLSQDFRNYKLYGIKHTEPEMLFIGSSRVMQIKGNFFKEKFYNAGGLIQHHRDLNQFLEKPISARFLFIGIDSWWYKADHVRYANTSNDEVSEYSILFKSRYNALDKIDKIFYDYFSDRTKKHVGIAAQTDNGGFRLDGSLKVSDERVNMIIKNPQFVDTEDPPIHQRIIQGTPYKFSYSNIDTNAFLSTVKLIKTLINNGKQVVVYLPPFTDESFDLFKITKEQNAFYQFTYEYIPKVLTKYRIPFINTETPRMYQLDDTYFMDGFHPSEVFVAHQLYKHAYLFNGKIDTTTISNSIRNMYCPLFLDSNEILNKVKP